MAVSFCCPAIKELVIRGGALKGNAFTGLEGNRPLICLESLEMTGCLQGREALESMAKLSTLKRLSITLSKDHPEDLGDLTPCVSSLSSLESLCLIGLDLHKQDLGCVSPLTNLRRLTHLDIRGSFLPFATYKTVVRGS